MSIVSMGLDINEVIKHHFWLGFQYDDIVYILNEYYGVNISKSTLLRRLRDLDLKRRHPNTSVTDVWNAIITELNGPGRISGYRSMCHSLKVNHNIQVSREIVRLILQQVDPVAVMNRKRHRLKRRTYVSLGPNHTWHIDGYDKLKPYGFPINGCIDGYSRKILWLECACSTQNPKVVAGFFLRAIEQAGGHPAKVRTDCGTENVHVAALQTFLTGSQRSHVYGSSPSNQRIESWWSFFRRSRSQWWISLFEDLVQCGAFQVGHARLTDCLRFCFMSLLRDDLQQVMCQWNTHRIRPSAGSLCPAGIPDMLYLRPVLPAVDCLIRSPPATSLPCTVLATIEKPFVCSDNDFGDYLHYLCTVSNWRAPETIDEGLQLYFRLYPLVQHIPAGL